MSDWQPIETAPKDGTPKLVWDEYWLMRVAKWDVVTEAKGGVGQWITDAPYGWERGEVEFPLEPTLWMPLPAAPTPSRSRPA